jgi:RNA polymerase sigma factor (sigma-70 family)
MTTSRMEPLIHHLRRTVLRLDGAGLTDGQLLESFIANRDEAAFEALVRRHGSMVLGVSRRILGNQHDAEDAFQATFLVLVRKAASVSPREMVGNWLYGVAHTTALRAKAAKARRRERQVIDMPEPKAAEPDLWRDLQPLLDEELARLPDKYRTAIVLCDLEGRTRKDVARQLKIPEGTLSTRLATARRMLAKRLTRHGLAFVGGSLAAVMSHNAVSAGVSGSLVNSTVKAAMIVAAGKAASGLISAQVAALTKGALKAMLLSKLKVLLAVVVLVGMIGTGAEVLCGRIPAADQPAQENKTPQRTRSPSEKTDNPSQAALSVIEDLNRVWILSWYPYISRRTIP